MKTLNRRCRLLVFACWLPLNGGALTAGSEDLVTQSISLRQEGLIPFAPVVQPPVEATGTIDSVEGSLITDLDGAFTTVFPYQFPEFRDPPQPLVLTILDGAHAGMPVMIKQFTATTLTADRDLDAFALDGASYELRRAWTMDSLMAGSRDIRWGTALTADVFWIWDDSITGYRRLYYSSGGISGVGWREVGKGYTSYSFFPIPPTKALFFQRRVPPSSLSHPVVSFAGVALTFPLSIPLEPGFNAISRGSLAPLTLGDSRLQEQIGPGGEASVHFLVWIQEDDGAYSRYYFSPGGLSGVGWRRVGGGSGDAAHIPLPPAFLIELRRPTSITIALPPVPR